VAVAVAEQMVVVVVVQEDSVQVQA